MASPATSGRILPGQVSLRIPAWGMLLAAAVAAYHGLVGYDPNTEIIRSSTNRVEELMFEPAGGSPRLLFAAAAFVLWRHHRRFERWLGAPASGFSLLLIPAVAVLAWAYYVDARDLLILSLAFALLGAAALAAGRSGLRAAVLPSLLLLLAIPIPAVLVNEIVYPIQLATASVTGWILEVIGWTNLVVGDRIFTQQQVFMVIEACSGLRIMHTLTMAALLYVDLFSCRRLHAVLIVLVAPLVGIVLNTLRVLTIVLNPYSHIASVHTAQGLVMIVVGVLVLALLDRPLGALARRVSGRTADQAPARFRAADSRTRNLRFAGLAAILGVFAVVPLLVPTWQAPSLRSELGAFPRQLDDWKATYRKADSEFLGSVGFSEVVSLRFERGEERIDLFAGDDLRLRRSQSIRSRKTAIPGSGRRVEASRRIELEPGRLSAEFLVVRSVEERSVVLHWYEDVGGFWYEFLRSFAGLERSPFRRQEIGRVVRISTPIGPSDEDREQAEQRLLDFAGTTRAALANLRPPRVSSTTSATSFR